MPIQPLSDSDVRALGSSLVINDAGSVIKELVENALDAHASIISIEISTNTVDVIQIRDNGSGINSEDRYLLGRRGCTSKIRTIQDLQRLGGSSLGFRGEALASVAALSGVVAITTKVDGELAGCTIKLAPDGSILGSTSASHPVGTTVRAENFLKLIPVRRQTALKSAPYILSSIKKVLQSYAFARPDTRFSFKVLKTKTEKYNWTYGPTSCPALSTTSLLTATAKILGQEVAAQCEERTWKSDDHPDGELAVTINALFVKEDADVLKAANKGHFISIDGRPLSSTRGLFKDFVKLYKTYYRHRYSVKQSKDCSTDPFLCLHLTCPVGSYDVNVEPAKDEVLFTDSEGLKATLVEFLRSVYGDLPDVNAKLRSPNTRGSRNIQNPSFDLLLAKRDPDSVSHQTRSPKMLSQSHQSNRKELDFQALVIQGVDIDPQSQNELPDKLRPTRGSKPSYNMYDIDEDCMSVTPSSSESNPNADEDESELRKASVTNPWTIAKVYAPVLPAKSATAEKEPGMGNAQLMTPNPSDGSSRLISSPYSKPLNEQLHLPSPARSESSRPSPPYQNPGPPLRRRPRILRAEEDEIVFTQEATDPNPDIGQRKIQDLWAERKAQKASLPVVEHVPHISGAAEGSKSWDRAKTKTNLSPIDYYMADPPDSSESPSPLTKNPRSPGFPLVKDPATSPTPHSPPRLSPTPSHSSSDDPPTRQPWNWGRNEQPVGSPASQAHPPPLSQSHRHPMASPPRLQPSPNRASKAKKQDIQPSNPELDEIMDFEYRKKAVNAQQRKHFKLADRQLNPTRLAQIQRETTASSQHSEISSSTPSSLREPGPRHLIDGSRLQNPHAAASRTTGGILESTTSFHQNPPQCDSQRPNPHQSRYQAAKACLAQPKYKNPVLHVRSRGNEISANQATATELAEGPPPLPSTDPRAYLIRHRNSSTSGSRTAGSGASTDVKPAKRTKTSKLPLECIPTGSALHLTTAKLLGGFPRLPSLKAQIRDLVVRADGYPLKGANQFVGWDATAPEIAIWEEKLQGLLKERHMARIGGIGEEVPVEDVKIELGVVLRAWCEEPSR